MEILGYFFAIIIGFTIGLLGGGGSILGVPVLHYVFYIKVEDAIGLSLFIVGVSSFIGSLAFFKKKLIDKTAVLKFGLPSVVAVFFVRKIILPILPNEIVHFEKWTLDKSLFLLLLFTVLMLIASIKMIRPVVSVCPNQKPKNRTQHLVIQGLFVGTVTGLVGAGGGFLIIPSLVIIVGLEMKRAIGTSLCIISLNSLIGFGTTYANKVQDWNFLLFFTILSVIGIFLGIWVSQRINSKRLKPIFGWFVLLIGVYIIIKELFFHPILHA